MGNSSERSTITGDLQNVFNYTFIETAPYHFIVPKAEKYTAVDMDTKVNHCIDCGRDVRVRFNKNGQVYIEKIRMQKQHEIYEKYKIPFPNINEEDFVYHQDGYCDACAKKHICHQEKVQDVCNACYELNKLDEAVVIKAQATVGKIVHEWIQQINSTEELAEFDLTSYIGLRDLICGVVIEQKAALIEILNEYTGEVVSQKTLIKAMLDKIDQADFTAYVARPTTIYETMDDELYNEYTVVFPVKETIEEEFYSLKKVEKNRVYMFLQQKRIESLEELLSEIIFEDVWIEWLIAQIAKLK